MKMTRLTYIVRQMKVNPERLDVRNSFTTSKELWITVLLLIDLGTIS